MSRTQRFFKAFMPAKWFDAAEAESKLWMVRCKCGAEQSIWDIGGIRWKSSGKTLVRRRCHQCGERSWHRIEKTRPS